MVLVAKPKRPVSIHQKKRTGQHHKSSKHFAKTYWPYLPLLLVIAAGFLVDTAWRHGSGQVLGDTANSITASTLLQEANNARASDHESLLGLNPLLMQAAQAKVNDMARNDYWSHDGPGGETPWTFMRQAGYSYAIAGENLAYGFGSSAAVTTGWMSSTEHRANILQPLYKDVGFGVVRTPNFQGHGPETLVVAMYAEPLVNQTAVATHASVLPSANTSLAAQSQQNITRVQMLGGGVAQWAVAAIVLAAIAASALLAARHARAWHRVIFRGEAFIMHHPVLDVALMGVIVTAAVLTRVVGSIH